MLDVQRDYVHPLRQLQGHRSYAWAAEKGKFGHPPLWGNNETCPVCKGERKLKCRNPQCHNGSVWVAE